jgi:hypothetical protein
MVHFDSSIKSVKGSTKAEKEDNEELSSSGSQVDRNHQRPFRVGEQHEVRRRVLGFEAGSAATRGIETPPACYLYCYCLYILAIGRETCNTVIKYNGLSLSIKHSKSTIAQESYSLYVKLDRRRRT